MLLKELSSHGLPLRLVVIILKAFSDKVIEFTLVTKEQLKSDRELTKEWIDNTWSSIKRNDRFSSEYLRHNELYLVLFDVNKKAKVSLSEFPVRSSKKN